MLNKIKQKKKKPTPLDGVGFLFVGINERRGEDYKLFSSFFKIFKSDRKYTRPLFSPSAPQARPSPYPRSFPLRFFVVFPKYPPGTSRVVFL